MRNRGMGNTVASEESSSRSRWSRLGWQDGLNGAAALGAVLLSFAFSRSFERKADEPATRIEAVGRVVAEVGLDGSRRLVDAAGQTMVLGEFARIASASIVADSVLLAVCDPRHVVAFSSWSKTIGPEPFRFAEKESLEMGQKLSSVLALRPDLVLSHGYGQDPWIAQLRDAGFKVFDLGPIRGMSTLLVNVEQIAWLCGQPARGRELAQSFERRMSAVAAESARRRGLYLSAFGGQLLGGTVGTSYHDVLEAGGLTDVAAARFQGWPNYQPRHLYDLDPEYIVTPQGQRESVCALPVLVEHDVCRLGRVVEVPEPWLSAPGLEMLEAAERVRAAVVEKNGP
jgi:iron complex transport system substrate-binding protein